MVATRSPPLVILNFLTLASSRFVLPQRNVSEYLLAASTQRLSEYEPEGTASTGPCTAFQLGNLSAQELYSPNYPHNYPNHSDCIRILSAEPGHLLKLDFRDEFNVEPSEECRFDYLEVRDGEHGYSPLIGKFCGHQFPPMLTSSSRYLWLRFRSDENIEYSGFRAVYTSVPRPTANGKEIDLPPCQMSRTGVEGYVNRSDIPVDRVIASVVHNIPLDCMWTITVQEGWKINLMFVKFSLERPNDCESNFIDVFPERTDLPSRLHNFCGSMAEMVSSRGSTLHIRFVAEPKAINSSFEVVFTAFRDRAKDEVCANGEYDCEDATCISNTLKCNGRANCRFRWDEDDCKSEVSSLGRLLQEEHMVIILIIFFMILTGMISAFIYNCARKLIRDSQLIKEQIQQSFSGRESSLCQKMPVATVLTPISTILPHMGDVVSASCASSAPASPRLPPCHVPLQPLDVTRLQHMSLDNFARASVETYAVFGRESSPVTAEKFTKEVKDNESQTKTSQYMFCSVDSLMPPPPPPPPRIATVFMETDLDFHPALLHKPPPIPLWGHSRSHESIPTRLRCSDVVAPMPTRRMAPDVIEAH